jgi:deoxyribonuclease-1
MHERYGVRMSDEELAMFEAWAAADPVSPWELERNNRIAAVQLNHNPFVAGHTPDADGACDWESDAPL